MKNIVTSPSNDLIKKVNKLRKKKYRKEYSSFVIESKKLIEEAFLSGLEVEEVLIRSDKEPLNYSANYTFIEENLFNKISSLVTPDGYMAIVKMKETALITDRILVLDKIQDPGNMGTLIRSAEAFAFDTIISISSVDFYNEKVLRSSMGSIFRLNLHEKSYDFLKELDQYQKYIADMDGKDFRKEVYPDKLCLIIGNEGKGISKKVEDLADKTIKIPMQGQIESLNAGVSGSILMAAMAKNIKEE